MHFLTNTLLGGIYICWYYKSLSKMLLPSPFPSLLLSPQMKDK